MPSSSLRYGTDMPARKKLSARNSTHCGIDVQLAFFAGGQINARSVNELIIV